MKEEIKEILKLYKNDDIEYYNEVSDLGYDKLLDYIVNLQEENKKYVNTLFEIKKYLLERLNEYKNSMNKENINHLAFKLLILQLISKTENIEIQRKLTKNKIPEKLEDKARFQYSQIPYWFKDKELIKTINENFEKHQKAIYEIIYYLKSKGE